MDSLEKTKAYSRLNTRMHSYISAVNSKADPEILHMELRELIAEAIKMHIPLQDLITAFPPTLGEIDQKEFEENIKKHFLRGESHAQSLEKQNGHL